MTHNMKNTLVRLAFVCVALLLPLRLLADPPKELLVKAYSAMAHADHDYKGHRGEAMKEVKKAAVELGFKLGGEGPGKEPQRVSDEHMRVARALLEQARAELKEKPKAQRHVENALKNITEALAIR
jgi:hypothetical protein